MEPVLLPQSRVEEKNNSKESHDIIVSPANEVPIEPRKKRIGEGRWYRTFFEPGSAAQIVVAALIAVAIGMAVNVSVDSVPPAVIAIVGIPGRLWLRALQAVGE